MDITKRETTRGIEVTVKGRLDAYWADHLTDALYEIIREGIHHITLNLRDVVYISSAGIRVLLQAHKQLKGLHGVLHVSHLSDQVQSVLDMAGLTAFLRSSSPSVEEHRSTSPEAARRTKLGDHTFDIYPGPRHASLTCEMLGNPQHFFGKGFSDSDCRTTTFPSHSFGIGLGAIGEDLAHCRGRFGEFISVAGSAAYLPTDNTNVPDFSLSAGTLVPTLQVLYGLKCAGDFSHLLRFESSRENCSVKLSDLVNCGLEQTGSEALGLVLIAESAGLVGAVLKRSPDLGKKGVDLFQHPLIRQWLSFTTDRSHTSALTLVVGIAARHDGGCLIPFLRPLAAERPLMGHFHAAIFSYRPLKRGHLDLGTTVSTLFETERLEGLLHLIHDYRRISGLGESEFVRGACWISPIAHMIGS